MEGEVLRINPGYIYNSWEVIFIRWEENERAGIYLYQNKDAGASKLIEVLAKDDIHSIEPSKRNPFVFLVNLKNPSTLTKKTVYYFKVQTSKEDRDNKVAFLHTKVPPLPPPPEVIPDLTGFKCKGTLHQIFPGYIINGWREVYMKLEETEGVLYLYENDKLEKVLEKINLNAVDTFVASQRNEYVFHVLFKAEEPTEGNKKKEVKKEYFKVLTNKEERDKWVYALKNNPVFTHNRL